MGLKIREESALPMFFGFVEHKTFVEYFGVTEFAKPQTKTRSGLSTSIHPGAIWRLTKEKCEEGRIRRRYSHLLMPFRQHER